MRGFTLVETLVALVVSTLVVLLVANLFLVQSDYYAWISDRARLQDVARSVVDVVASEVRSVPSGGVVAADSARLVIRKPLRMGAICAFVGSDHVVHVSGGTEAFDTDAVAGFGLRDDDGEWTFHPAAWSTIHGGDAGAASACADQGADTAGVVGEYLRLRDLETLSGRSTDVGDVVLFYRPLELRFGRSELDTLTTGLFVGTRGGVLTEFASGLAAGARFGYRTGGTTYVTSVGSGSLAAIDGVRVRALTTGNPTAGIRGVESFELVSDIRLRNVR